MKFKLSQATKMTYTAKKQRERYCRALGRSKHRKPERWERFPVCCVGQREGNTWRFATHSSDVNKPLCRPTHKCTKHMFSHSEQVTCRRILTRRNLTHALRITQRTTEAHVNGGEKCKKTNVQEIKHLFRASQITWQFALLCFHFRLTFWPAVMDCQLTGTHAVPFQGRRSSFRFELISDMVFLFSLYQRHSFNSDHSPHLEF